MAKGDKRQMKIILILAMIVIVAMLFLSYFDIRSIGFIRMSPAKTIRKIPEALNTITPVKDAKHYMISAFIDHRLDRTIRVISIINRHELQPLYCIYCTNGHDCKTTESEVQIHWENFGFAYHASDVICKGKDLQNATHVLVSTNDSIHQTLDFLPIKNNVQSETFKYDFTVCVSNLFNNYNNVLQFAQTIELYKLLGIGRVVIYNTSCGPDLEKLLRYYEGEGVVEMVSWPIDKFLVPSVGWHFNEHPGDIHYYGQLVTLNECVYRYMYQSKYVLLNDIDEIPMPYQHDNLTSLMENLQAEHPDVAVFGVESHVFSLEKFDDSGRFKRIEWSNIPGVNIMEHIYREPHRPYIFNPAKMIVNPRLEEQTSVHSSLKHFGGVYVFPHEICRLVHIGKPLQGDLPLDQLIVDKRLWDFQQELVPNVNKALKLSGLLNTSLVLQ